MNPNKKSLFRTCHPYALTTSVFWSLAYVLTRVCTRHLLPLQVGALRCFTAAVTMIIVLVLRRDRLPRGRDMLWLALSGFAGFFLYMIFFNLGCARVTTATGNVVLALQPVITALGALLLFRERLLPIQWVSIGIAFGGVVILTAVSGGFSLNSGLLYLSAAVLVLSCYNLLSRYLGRRLDPMLITAYSIIFGALFLSPISPGAFQRLPSAPPLVWLCPLLLGTCCSGLAYCAWNKAFSMADKASTVSNYASLNPFISTVFGYFLIGDPVEPSAIYGGSVIMLGLLLFNFGPRLSALASKGRSPDRDGRPR